jgi:hypothetical protein
MAEPQLKQRLSLLGADYPTDSDGPKLDPAPLLGEHT